MTKLTISGLADLRNNFVAKQDQCKGTLLICSETGCIANKTIQIKNLLEKELKQRNLENDYNIVPTGCLGLCAKGPILLVQPEGILYFNLKPKDVNTIIDQHLINGEPVQDLMYKETPDSAPEPKMKNINFYKDQMFIVLINHGLINPEQIEDYIGNGGYQSLVKALTELQPDQILAEVETSGLRGRGGGGFPTGIKWETCKNAASGIGAAPYVVCNADEGDPGAFMDRSIIEGNPHSVIEGMLICARAIGAHSGYVYIRNEYPRALKRLRRAVRQAREFGLLGKNILGTDFSFDIRIHQGAGAFVCGESTALMNAMEGKVGEPRPKYIHLVEIGYKGLPTVLNNVETFANIPAIIEQGGAWFASIGTGDVSKSPWKGSSGTKVFSIVGDVNNTGLIEVPMGITLRDIVYKIGDGIPDGKKFKAVQTGGPSGGCLPEKLLNLAVDFDTLTKAGSMMGSGGLIVMDESRCMVDVAKYFTDFLVDESCGRCTPCREGLIVVHDLLTKIVEGKGDPVDLDLLDQISETMKNGSLCALGKSAPNPVLSTLKYFRSEYDAHIVDKKCPAGVCKALITYNINANNCNGCGVCLKNCPQEAITGEKKKPHVIDQNKCGKCGVCVDSCKFDAVEVV